MMTDVEMADAEVADQIERADRFVADFRERDCATIRRTSTGIALDKLLDAALRGGVLDLIEVQLMCVGGGLTLDYESAAEFLAAFDPMIETARKRLLQ